VFLQEIISEDRFLSAEILEERAKEQRNNSCSADHLAVDITPKGPPEPCKRPKSLAGGARFRKLIKPKFYIAIMAYF
jgi:hypothetical protein